MSKEIVNKFYNLDLTIQFWLAFIPAVLWINLDLISETISHTVNSKLALATFLIYVLVANSFLGLVWTFYSNYLKYTKIYTSEERWKTWVLLGLVLSSTIIGLTRVDTMTFLTATSYVYLVYFLFINMERLSFLRLKNS
jgi:hypothetical protein